MNPVVFHPLLGFPTLNNIMAQAMTANVYLRRHRPHFLVSKIILSSSVPFLYNSKPFLV